LCRSVSEADRRSGGSRADQSRQSGSRTVQTHRLIHSRLVSPANRLKYNGGMATHSINITETIDRQQIGSFQKKIAALCSVIAALEGFNTQSVGYVAPALAQAFRLQANDLGLFFSLGLFGLLCGAVLVAPIADRIGRRPILLLCIPLLGSFSMLTAFSTSLVMLDVLRFATGLAVGGALPNTIALTSEYSPRRRRALMVAVMFSGFIVGSIIAGLAASWLRPIGWQSVF